MHSSVLTVDLANVCLIRETAVASACIRAFPKKPLEVSYFCLFLPIYSFSGPYSVIYLWYGGFWDFFFFWNKLSARLFVLVAVMFQSWIKNTRSWDNSSQNMLVKGRSSLSLHQWDTYFYHHCPWAPNCSQCNISVLFLHNYLLCTNLQKLWWLAS